MHSIASALHPRPVSASLFAVTDALYSEAFASTEKSDRTYSLAEYRAMLRRLHAAACAMATKMRWELLADRGLPCALRRAERLGLLHDDLALLGEEISARPLFPALSEKEPTSFARTLGFAFVIEGSAITGRDLAAPYLRQHPHELEYATRFLSAYGRETRLFWSRFLKWLNQLDLTSAEIEEALQATREATEIASNHLFAE